MQDKDLPEFTRMMAKLSLVYPKQLTPELIDIYWQALKQKMSVHALGRVCFAMLQTRTSSFFPVPGELVEAWRSLPDDDGPLMLGYDDRDLTDEEKSDSERSKSISIKQVLKEIRERRLAANEKEREYERKRKQSGGAETKSDPVGQP